MQAGQSDWKHVTKYTIADGQTEGIWYDAGGTFIGDNHLRKHLWLTIKTI